MRALILLLNLLCSLLPREGVMGDRLISCKCKGKMLISCYPSVHVWASEYGTNRETTGESAGLSKEVGRSRIVNMDKLKEE